MLQQLVPALRMTLLLTILTGLVYPGVVTGVCQLLFRNQANGSLIVQNGNVIGSSLIGQNFAKPEYFHPRPSAAGNDGYDPTASPGSIPADALTASGSGLDPDISLANVSAQAARVAQARNVPLSSIERLITSATKSRDIGFLGEPRVNVLELNLTLDRELRNH